ncbi:MAG: hypothetical protein WCG27_06465, partial [Pseudomonadota bacterium]
VNPEGQIDHQSLIPSTSDLAGLSFVDPSTAFVETRCFSDTAGISVQSLTLPSSPYPNCSSDKSGICIEAEANNIIKMGARELPTTLSDANALLYVQIVRNMSVNNLKLAQDQFNIQLGTLDTTSPTPTISYDYTRVNNLPLLGQSTAIKSCKITLSGVGENIAVDSKVCTSASVCLGLTTMNVTNGKLVFNVDITGRKANDKVEITYNNANIKDGILEVANQAPTTIIATVKINDQLPLLYCGVKIMSSSSVMGVDFRSFGSESYLNALVKYYRPTPTYSIKLEGDTTQTAFHDNPYRGPMDAAVNSSGYFQKDGNGQIIPYANNPYKSPIVVGYRYDPQNNQVGAAVIYGQISLARIPEIGKTSMQYVGVDTLQDEDFVVFKAFLPSKSVIIRSHVYDYVFGSDRAIPFAETSCIPPLQEYFPQVPAISFTGEFEQIKNTTICVFSKPLKGADILAGREKLQLLSRTGDVKEEPPVIPPLVKCDLESLSADDKLDTTSCIQWPSLFNSATWKDDKTKAKGIRYSMEAMAVGASLICTWLNNKPTYANVDITYGTSSGAMNSWPGLPCSGKDPGTMVVSQAPKKCVQEVRIMVGNWGDAPMCDNDVTKPQWSTLGNFCLHTKTSLSYAPSWVNSHVKQVTVNGKSYYYGGNYFAVANVPMCPNNAITFTTISLSWSPIIIDIGGKGVRLSRDGKLSIWFDINGDGKKERIDWIHPDFLTQNALLVRPGAKIGEGSIANLFGARLSENGFEELKAFDTNKDGKIDKKDKAYSQLRLWFDKNRNGVIDEGELMALKEAGVKSISLKYLKPLDSTKGAAGKVLTSKYYNQKTKKEMAAEDHYFNEYDEKMAPKVISLGGK